MWHRRPPGVRWCRCSRGSGQLCRRGIRISVGCFLNRPLKHRHVGHAMRRSGVAFLHVACRLPLFSYLPYPKVSPLHQPAQQSHLNFSARSLQAEDRASPLGRTEVQVRTGRASACTIHNAIHGREGGIFRGLSARFRGVGYRVGGRKATKVAGAWQEVLVRPYAIAYLGRNASKYPSTGQKAIRKPHNELANYPALGNNES